MLSPRGTGLLLLRLGRVRVTRRCMTGGLVSFKLLIQTVHLSLGRSVQRDPFALRLRLQLEVAEVRVLAALLEALLDGRPNQEVPDGAEDEHTADTGSNKTADLWGCLFTGAVLRLLLSVELDRHDGGGGSGGM